MTDLSKLASDLLAKGPHKLEPTTRRVRVLFNKIYIADTTSARHVWEHPYYPQYYLPLDSIKPHTLTKGKPISHSTNNNDGAAFLGSLRVNDRSTERVLIFEKGPLADLVRLEFGAMDAWYEEDKEIYVHPKDPYKRVDILPSSRKVTVGIEDKTVAESAGGMFLIETGLPTRYYLPQTSVKWEYVTPSDTTSSCPYKGQANYYNVTIDGKEHKDAIWWYQYPTPESIAIAGMVCFYNEKVDIWIDGVKQERPISKFG
ncbi:MAG: hypothetical protein M1830_000177 [Pleopsidium flavum]|nr:MAG: hypothetical protein M1830_000177 [Pleopsidium flavum]